MGDAFAPRLGDWQWYEDAVGDPSTSLAAENTQPTLSSGAPIVRLRVEIVESGGKPSTASYWTLEYSTNASDWVSLGAANHWNWANGGGTDGNNVSGYLVADSGSLLGQYWESTTNTDALSSRAVLEADFAVQETANVQGNTVYYFRVGIDVKGALTYPAVDSTYGAGTYPNVKTALQEVPETITLDVGSMTIPGENLLQSYTLTQFTGTVTFTGKDAQTGQAITQDKGTLALTPQAMLLNESFLGHCGSLALTPKVLQANLTYTVDKGTITHTGKDVASAVAQILARGIFTLTGKDVTLRLDEYIQLVKETITHTGKDVTANIGEIIQLAKETITATGQSLSILSGEAINMTRGAIALTGKILRADEVFNMLKGSVTFTGKTITDLVATSVELAKGTITATGKTLFTSFAAVLNKVSLTLTGKDLSATVAGAAGAGRSAMSRLNLKLGMK